MNNLSGEFTHIDVAQPDVAAIPSNPIAKAHAAMVVEIACFVPPCISVSPSPGEFEDVADYIERVTRAMDRWLKEIGQNVQSNSTTQIDMCDFEDRFFAAIDGCATFELDRVAQDLSEANPAGQRYCPTRRSWFSVAAGGR